MAVAAAVAVQGGRVQQRSGALVGTGVLAAASLLLLFNLLDGLFTLTFLQLGVAEELNPLMRWAYEVSPLFFMALKLAIVNAGVLILWAHRVVGASRVAMAVGAVLYAGIVLYHLGFLSQLL